MFRYLHVSIASAAVSALLLATASPGAFAAEKKNPAGKEAVERYLLGKYLVTTFSPGRGPAPGGVVVQIMKQGLESSPAHAITPVFNYKDGRLRKSLATNALKELAPLPFQSRMYITKIEARDNHILFRFGNR